MKTFKRWNITLLHQKKLSSQETRTLSFPLPVPFTHPDSWIMHHVCGETCPLHLFTHAGQHQRQKAAVGHLKTARLQAEQVIWLWGNDPPNPWNVQQGTHSRMMQERVLLLLDCILPSTKTAGTRWMCLCRVNVVKISYPDRAGGLQMSPRRYHQKCSGRKPLKWQSVSQ